MQFAPIAIVGQGCMLPGAHHPEQLWQTVLNAQMHLGTPENQYWGLGSDLVTQSTPSPDHTWSDRGGYVRDFDAVFDPQHYLLGDDDVSRFDPLFQWSLYAARQALQSAQLPLDMQGQKAGVILGNLSYPTPSMAQTAQRVWQGLDLDREAALQRFMSGLPAHVVARAFNMQAGAYALDAACASSLYAIKLACDWLHDGKADVMLAGGVNHADDLFIHIGFCALNAMSKTGQSRPFHAQADGLVPAEGAGFVALMRLEDAIAQDKPILGLIRSVGLSNDGRGRGLLTPSEQGQVRAMKVAYEQSGLSPDDVSLIECHATGTPLGDGTELRSMARIFDGRRGLPVGSLKANMGHLITASGVAGLMKVLSSMKHKILPPVINVDEPNPALVDSPFRLVKEAEQWQPNGKRCAVVNNFGFGGNNAHLLIEAWEEDHTFVPPTLQPVPHVDEDIAIVGLGLILGEHDQPEDILASLLRGEDLHEGQGAQVKSIEFDLKALRFPPNDLKQTLPQQLLVLHSGFKLAEQIANLPQERTGILTGMQCDAEIARYGARWRLAQHLEGDALKDAREGIVPGLKSAGVLGTMPNIVANRLNSQFDLLGPSFTVSSEELSGTIALDVAARALRHGQLDAALVNAVDMSCEPVHQKAVSTLMGDAYQLPADVAVTLVLKRLSDARRDGDTIYARLPAQAPESVTSHVTMDADGASWLPQIGHAHAASGLLQVALQALCLHHRVKPNQLQSKAQPWLPQQGHRSVALHLESFYGQRQTLHLIDEPSTNADVRAVVPVQAAKMVTVAAPSKEQLMQAIIKRQDATQGPWRAAWVVEGDDSDVRQALFVALSKYTESDGLVAVDNHRAWIGHGQNPGQLAYVFTGPAGAYPGMGRELLLHVPELIDGVAEQFKTMEDAVGWIYQPGVDRDRPPVDKLWGSSFLCQVHAQWTRKVLNLEPNAAIGFCSGETNAAFALGAWRGLDSMRQDIEDRGVFERALGGTFETLKSAWQTEQPEWATWRLLVDENDVAALVEDEPRVHLTIINAPGDVVIAGEPEACQRVIDQVGRQRARELGYNIVMHCPEARQFEGPWHDLHHRPTQHIDGVRFYTNATLSAYESSADNIAHALTGQAMDRVDFPALVQKAWEDGVRVFVEHGPHAGCTQWIQKTLKDKPHVAMALDRYGVSSLEQALGCAAQLFALGYDVDLARAQSIGTSATTSDETSAGGMMMAFPGHWPSVRFPANIPVQEQIKQEAPKVSQKQSQSTSSAPAQVMKAPPRLPSVYSEAPAPTPQQTHQPVASTPKPAPVQSTTQPVAQQIVTPQPVVHAQQGAATPSNHPMVNYFEQVATIHETYLRQQAELQAQFIAQRQSMMQHLFGAPITVEAQTVTHVPAAAQPPVVQPIAQPVQPAPQTSRPAPKPAQPVARPAVVAKTSTPKPTPKPATPSVSKKPVVSPKTVAAKPTPKPASKSVTNTEKTTKRVGKADAFRPTVKRAPVGPTIDREGLKIHASGNISEIFGDLFKQQDQYAVQVRMPEPPLLLCDRVTGIDAEPGVHSTGTMWTETDVREDSWYLHEGRMPTGIMIESGQADLMLISWMGADFLNKGERSYRLLGCDLRFHGPLPQPGETLVYDIHVDGHAKQNDVRLFFFHYDCTINDQVRLSVRGGQAGFFTREELDASNGILWSPEDETVTEGRLDPPRIPAPSRSFTRQQIEAYANGDLTGAFGPGFEFTQTHTRTPRIQTGDMLFLDEIEVLDFAGGPWGRGYLRAVQHIDPNTWFFDGHFKNDPCMPGTLMFEGCVQAMAFYMASLGLTIDNDGWVFEPVPDITYKLRCRGQVVPESKRLTYEVFVKEVHDGDEPMLFADLLCTIDGLKAFHCGRMGLKLSPAWILDRQTDALKTYVEPKPVAKNANGFEFGYDSLLACAWGRPTRAFGEMYEVFDTHRRVARLPGPPYHFISRVTKVDQPMGQMKSGVNLEVEYDVPVDAWYFRENGSEVMPYAVLLEAGLQPCGWLASYVGCALSKDIDMYFRNLDGTANQHAEVTPQTGTLRSNVVLKSIAQAAGSIIVSFDVEMRAPEQNNELIFTMDTVFGFFPKEALAQQAGLEASDEYKHWVLEADNDTQIDLTTQPEAFYQPSLRLADPMLLMIDHITGYWPEGGEAGLGRIRATKDVDTTEWFFKAHFFQDPVQPGSLGIEAMLQLLQSLMVLKNLHEGFTAPRFEAIAVGQEHSWKYRGQVLPKNKLISSSVEINSIERDERGVLAIASASLWVDGMRIYLAKNLAMRIVETGAIDPFDQAHDEETQTESTPEPQDIAAPAESTWQRQVTIDLDRAPWLNDHCPTYTAPAVPMMNLLDDMAKAVRFLHPERQITRIEQVSLKRWVIVESPQTLQIDVAQLEDHHFQVTLRKWWEAPNPKMSRFEDVATGHVHTADGFPTRPNQAIVRLKDPQSMPNPYETGVLFHGPAFQVVESYQLGSNGADGRLTVQHSPVPRGVINPVLLDGALQVIPHGQFYLWCNDLEDEFIAYPYAVEDMVIYSETPVHGFLQTQVRFVERRDERFVVSDIHILADNQLWATMRLVEILLPKGRLGRAESSARQSFLRDGRFQLGVGLSELQPNKASVSTQDYKQSEWFKNTIGTIYQVEGSLEEKTALVAIKDAVGQWLHEHPARLNVEQDVRRVTSDALPWLTAQYNLSHPTTQQFEATALESTLQTDELAAFWKARLGVDEKWLGIDVYQGLVEQFVRKVSLEDPEDFEALKGRSVIFLGNHQVQIESLLITAITSCLNQTHVTTMANAKHEAGWVGQLIRQLFDAPGCVNPGNIIYFDQSQPSMLLKLIEQLKVKIVEKGGSLMVHAPGTRARNNRQEVDKVSSLFIDMAIDMGMPIVPVYFSGGLPNYDVENKLEFPVGYGKQDYYLGRAIMPEQLAETPYARRRHLILDGINRLGESTLGYTHQPNVSLSNMIQSHQQAGMNEINAVLLAVLKALEHPRSTTTMLLDAVNHSKALPDDPMGQWLTGVLKRFDVSQ